MRYNLSSTMTLGIYIQVPFCQTKCTYCNFHTGVVSRDRYQPYANAVCREIESEARSFKDVEWRGFNPAVTVSNGRGALAPEANAPSSGHSLSPTVDTIYFGGGTPSLLAPDVLAQILNVLRATFHLTAPEITLEADPETITAEKAQSWLAAGFNRISLGAQSFHDRELIAAGRMQRRDDIYSAAKILRAAGLDNISMDLIIGLPHQTRDSWRESVTQLLALRPAHVSIYMLEIDEGSRLGRESLAGGARYGADAIPPDDMQAEFYDSACKHLAAAGYDHYEISNWALPGMRSRHNLKYWQRAPYLGLGAGAHSFDGRTRWANIHDSALYVSAIEQGISPREQIEPVTSEQALEEEFLLGLRKLEGVDLAQLKRDYAANGKGTSTRFAKICSQIDSLCSQGLLTLDSGRLRLAPGRFTISNSILAELLA